MVYIYSTDGYKNLGISHTSVTEVYSVDLSRGQPFFLQVA